MVNPPRNDLRLHIIAAHLFSWRHTTARRHMLRRNLRLSDLLRMDRDAVQALGFPETALEGFPGKYLDLARKELQTCQQLETRLILRGDPEYPPLLEEIYDSPEVLYVCGDPGCLQGNLLAVVGSRKSDNYGKTAVLRLIPPLCAAGIIVVSGMAWGIDAHAHRAALDSGRPTVGVNAAGMDHLHPPGNRSLLNRIKKGGCIVCEAPLGTSPQAFLFPVRNRIISGLCRAVLVVQGTCRSGSMITARMALDQNRELMAVPGPIQSPLSSGPHRLIQQGCKLVTRAVDILEEYDLVPLPSAQATEGLSPRERRVLDLMESDGVKRIDDFVETLDLSVPVVVSLLLELTMKGFIREEGDGYLKLI